MIEDILSGSVYSIIEFVKQLPWYSILLFSLFITFLENVFPPSPSDTILIFCGSLVCTGTVDFIPLLLASTIGSTIGFLLMFYAGEKYGVALIESKYFKFISQDTIEKSQIWFRKYGYSIIFINRFLSGTRAVISFVAGISKMKITNVWFLAAFGALIWNAMLIWLGMFFGKNWQIADNYISHFGYYILAIIIIAFLVYCFFTKRKKRAKK